MSAEKFEPGKFDVGGRYRKDEFIFILESLIAGMVSADPLAVRLNEIVKWAEQHADGTTFVWDERPDGATVSVAEFGVNVAIEE